MKKAFFLLLVCAFAWMPSGKAQVGAHVNYSPERWMSTNDTIDFSSYVFGVDFLIPVTGDLNVTIGVQGRWGSERGDGIFQIDTNNRINVVGVEVPMLFNYRLRLSKTLSITPFAGPKFSYYIKGKSRNNSGHTTYEWFDQEETPLKKPMNRLNISATFGLAVGFNKFYLFGGYNMGLLDMDQYDNKETTVGGPFFGLAVGF